MLAKLKLVTLCAKMRVVDDASLSAARRTGTVLSVSLVAISSSGGALSLFRCKLLSTTFNLESFLRALCVSVVNSYPQLDSPRRYGEEMFN